MTIPISKSPENIAVLVLAAGQGSRMGTIKQLLPWKGTTFLEHTLNKLILLKGLQIYVVLGAHYESIVSACNLKHERISHIRNDQWEDGLSTSIRMGLKHILETKKPYNGVMVCLADQPLFTLDFYTQMLALFSQGNHKIIATSYEKRSGVPAVFDMDCITELLTLEGDRGAQQIMKHYKDQMLVLDAGTMNQDIDTLETYEQLYKLYNTP
jgi:molybdenum cofactor cytidylyltransferase